MSKASILHSWEEFDQTLKEIAKIDIRVHEAEAVRDNDLMVAQSTFDKRTREVLGRKAILAVELELFYAAHRKERETAAKKSIDLQFGRAGMRKGISIIAFLRGWTKEKAVAAMEASEFWKMFLQYTPSIGKQAVKDAAKSQEELALVGLTLKPGKEVFYFETFPEKLESGQ